MNNTLYLNDQPQIAPEITARDWINSEALTLDHLLGKVVVIVFIRKSCPGTKAFGLEFLKRIANFYRNEDEVEVIGVHSFLHNYGKKDIDSLNKYVAQHELHCPIAIDEFDCKYNAPETYRRYKLSATPSIVVVDHLNRIKSTTHNRVSDMRLATIVTRESITAMQYRKMQEARNMFNACLTDADTERYRFDIDYSESRIMQEEGSVESTSDGTAINE